MRAFSIVIATLCCCKSEPKQEQAPPPTATPPVRGAVGDSDLRVMLAEVASSKACEMMRGQFRGLFAPDRPELVTGVLWIRNCKITNDGTRVRFELAGSGWQWAEQRKKKAGGTFVVREYVKFGVKIVIPGALDIAYDRATHVVSLWFTPSATPQIEFTPIGPVDVDSKGMWSKVIGAVSSIFSDSPDEQGAREAKRQGTRQFETELANGMTIAIDLCTGYQRFSLGRPKKGSLGRPNPGESLRVPIELQPAGLLVFGPYFAPHGMTARVHSSGPVRVALVCAEQAQAAADAFVHDRVVPVVPALGETVVSGDAKLAIKPTSCKVAMVARPVSGPITFDWQRPRRESGRATGGPAIHCGGQTAISSPQHGSGALESAAARRR